jgi:succinyl-diaminopimelate desuccinylase
MLHTADRIKVRNKIRACTRSRVDEVVEIALSLLAIRTETPPGDTHKIAHVIDNVLKGSPNILIEHLKTGDHVTNVLARVVGGNPGKRLIFNGHLDTFPLGAIEEWTADPSGEVRNNRLYGLGISDMKGGVAAAMFAIRILADFRSHLSGELVGTFVGDEETLGALGTKYLLDNVEHARGDAMISGDIGTPQVLRFGEKGMIWFKLVARGRAAHAAHVHKGDSAIEKLIRVMEELKTLRAVRPEAPFEVERAIAASRPISERYSGVGESEVLSSITVTFGTICGGRLPNLVADHAEVTVDVRLPVGTTVDEVLGRVNKIVESHQGVTLSVSGSHEPTWTDPDHPVIRVVAENCRETLKVDPAVNMRIGASDARLYRAAGIPSVVCGLTPYNLGTADEYVELDELKAIAEIFTLSAFDYLTAD